MRRGQKAAGLNRKMAELPKDEPLVSSAFLFGHMGVAQSRRKDAKMKDELEAESGQGS